MTDEHDSPCPISCSMSTPPSSAAHGTWLAFLAVLYSAWKLNGVPEQSALLVFWNPFAALATTKPVWPVVRSATEALSPPTSGVSESGTSLIDTLSTSPGLIFRVLALPRNVAALVNEKLTGSMQLLLQVAKLKLHSRLSIVSAAHHLVLLQLTASVNGVNPGG